jgi:hypothetical protein
MNPEPFDLVSIHVYADAVDRWESVVRRSGRPVFVGEFGVPGEDEPGFRSLLERVRRAPLAAVWVFDRSGDEFNFTAEPPRAWIWDALSRSAGVHDAANPLP